MKLDKNIHVTIEFDVNVGIGMENKGLKFFLLRGLKSEAIISFKEENVKFTFKDKNNEL